MKSMQITTMMGVNGELEARGSRAVGRHRCRENPHRPTAHVVVPIMEAQADPASAVRIRGRS